MRAPEQVLLRERVPEPLPAPELPQVPVPEQVLLQEREYSLDMIAGLCGFSSANYLCRVFKRETGQTPAAWRDSNAPAPTRHLPPQSNEIYL